jgi:N4-(beta-N-acetylglucosaminyl)-L-asparaginase
MSHGISRRKLLTSTAAIAAAPLAKALEMPTIWVPQSVEAVVISSANGNTYKAGGNEVCVEKAHRLITEGRDVLEAIIEGVNLNELDPGDTSVGYGGLPNAEGIVQLDASVMHGPKKQAGAVACLEGVRTPSKVAKLVMEQTDHHLLVGKGAQDFARNVGFSLEADLNTETSRRIWLEWKRRTDPEHYLDPSKRLPPHAEQTALASMIRDGIVDEEHAYGTINCLGINGKGELCGCTTTSGLAFKIPGRVGDSPILGAGLYVDGAIGGAGSTGRGEANLFNLCSFLIVEELRRGKHPKDAGMEAVKRIAANTIEKRLLDEKGRPNFGILFYILDAKGRHASVSLSGNRRYAVCDSKGPRTEAAEALFPG